VDSAFHAAQLKGRKVARKIRSKAATSRTTISVLGYSILSLLTRKERSGYELSRFTSGVRSTLFASSGHSNIYKELAKLKRDEYVTFRVMKEARPFDKKLYSLTARGGEALRTWLRAEPGLFSNRRELNIRAHALWLVDDDDAASILDKQIEIAKAEIEALRHHSEYLQEDNEVSFPPTAQHPLFGTYSNIMLEIDSRKLMVRWCTWMKEQRGRTSSRKPK
jgi:DNA-binding PadR family transcriptional regulator